MTELKEEIAKYLVENSTNPLVFRGYLDDWSLCQWPLEKWCEAFGEKRVPFRCQKKNYISDEPCWERQCSQKMLSFKEFMLGRPDSKEWMYFDYKYLHHWFDSDSEISKNISWRKFGYPEKGAEESTLWVGSEGAHTPAHKDTFGVNIIAQVFGRKRWLLFPPETVDLKATRVPYEESSIYSELNFYCPSNVDDFKGLSGGFTVELSAGDALLVPRGWWHYVQNIEPVNISVNIWLPHENDDSTRVSEALIKILVAQVCKDLPEETAKLLVNPNEDDLADTPLAVLFLQLETVVTSYLDKKRKTRRAKRQKTCDGTEVQKVITHDIKSVIENENYRLEMPKEITGTGIVELLRENLSKYSEPSDNEVDGSTSSLRLTKAVIDAFSDTNVIDLVKQNLLAKLG